MKITRYMSYFLREGGIIYVLWVIFYKLNYMKYVPQVMLYKLLNYIREGVQKNVQNFGNCLKGGGGLEVRGQMSKPP